MVSRTKTGIQGLDQILGGGLPSQSVTTLVGQPGTGKTILSLQFLYEGAKKGENGIFLTLEELAQDILEQGECLGWGISELVKDRNLVIKHINPSTVRFPALFESLADKVKKENVKRLVIDSATTLWMFSLKHGTQTDSAKRQQLWQILRDIRELGCTTILTAEARRGEGSEWYTRDTVSEFLCDVLILLDKNILGEIETRTLAVLKARKTGYLGGAHTFEIRENKGIVIELPKSK